MSPKWLLFLLYLLLSITGSAQQTKLDYQFSIDTTTRPASFLVELRIKGSDSGITHIRLPDKWANQEKLYKAITGFTLANTSFIIEKTADSAIRRIQHQPGELLKIKYRLQQDWDGPLTYGRNYRAVANSRFIHVTGYGLLAVPVLADTQQISFTFDWSRMPKRWTIANSFHTGTRKHNGIALLKDLQNSIFVAGDYRLHQTNVNGQPVYLAIRGQNWKFADTTMLSAIKRVISAQRQFWNDHTEPYYLVTMTPFEESGHINGSCLFRSFLTGMSTEFPFDWNIYGLLSHEYFHRWNGLAIQMKGDEQENAWLGEGFTEYYSYKLLYKSGLMTQEDYVTKTNSTIAEYYLSPVRNNDRKTLGKNFWLQRDYQIIPYKKGFVYALLLDHFINTRTNGKKSLDDLMFALYDDSKKGAPLTDTSFLEHLLKLTGEDFTRQHHAFVNAGHTIPVAPGSMGPAVSDSLVELSPFELGFDWSATAGTKIITGVIENSQAWKAGLRDGQKWRGGSIHFDNIVLPALVNIELDGKMQEIRYQPVASKKEWVRQFYPRQGEKGRP
jgi:predicted metalloprotease with PDZ domain